MAAGNDREELYRRLEQVRRHIAAEYDTVTKTRMIALADVIQQQLAEAEAGDTDAPEGKA
ncbi:MAG: hypothetical protein ABWY18_20295 [Tardiphaga sp.]